MSAASERHCPHTTSSALASVDVCWGLTCGVHSTLQALGMTLPYSSSIPAEDPLKMDECRMAGAAALNLLRLDLKPRDIMVRLPPRGGGGGL